MMPKPNRYAANGKIRPNGTQEGQYEMRNGHWVHKDSPVGRREASSVGSSRSFGSILGCIALMFLVVAFMGALTGCQVNVVNVIHSDIGVQAVSEAQHAE